MIMMEEICKKQKKDKKICQKKGDHWVNGVKAFLDQLR